MSAIVLAPSETRVFRVVQAVLQLIAGRNNATGTVTLTANAATTTVMAPNCAPGAIVLLSEQTANAGAARATTYVKPADVLAGSFKVTHANNAQTDRTFGWVVLG